MSLDGGTVRQLREKGLNGRHDVPIAWWALCGMADVVSDMRAKFMNTERPIRQILALCFL
jgi:hypothetical protein